MESGVEVVDDAAAAAEAEADIEGRGGALRFELPGDESRMEYLGKELADQDAFYMPAYRHMLSGSQESLDAVFDEVENGEEFHAMENGVVMSEGKDQISEESGDFGSGEKTEEALEGVRAEVFEGKSNGVEAQEEVAESSVTVADDGEKPSENGDFMYVDRDGDVQEQIGNEEFRDAEESRGDDSVALDNVVEVVGEVVDEGQADFHEQVGNGVAVEANIDNTVGNNGAESVVEVVQHVDDDSVVMDSSHVGQIRIRHSETVKHEDGIIGRSYASVVKEGTSEQKLNQEEGEGASSGSNDVAREQFDRESVLVEDIGESRSIDDEDNYRSSTQSRPIITSISEMNGGPSLPSGPAGIGSSSGCNNDVSEQFDRESVLVEDLGDSSSTLDDDKNRTFIHPTPPTTSIPTNGCPSRPAGLGSSAPLPAPRTLQQPRANGAFPLRQSQISEEVANDDSEENDETREKLQMIRVKFLRLAHRLGQTPHNVVVAQVLYRLGLAEQLRRNTNRPGVFSFDRASVMAEQLEAAGRDPLDFSCTIMVIGKSGVGKSATINSIFGGTVFQTDAFQVGTTKVQDMVGTVEGIKIKVIDTPGLFPSSSDQQRNVKFLHSVKRFISMTPPDIVLYFDRLDMQSRDYGDVPLLRSITDIFGTSIWFNAIVVLTHAASAPPEGPNGAPLSYEMFVSQRSHVVQQAIRQAAGDLRLMNPVSLVENHSACRTNRAGQRVLPNGQVWKPQLLLLSFASKILAEANMLLKLQDTPGRPYTARMRTTPLPVLLSSLLQSRPQLKLPEEQQLGEDTDEDLEEASDSDDGNEYDELPPFKSLTKSQLAKLSKAQRKAYFEELDYREKHLFRKQLKEEKLQRKMWKKMADAATDLPPQDRGKENVGDDTGGTANVPVPMPDLILPSSFDSDNPTHRYRFLDTSNQWVVRPVLETQGWDHDVGYEGLNVERFFAIKDEIPLSVSSQFTKDKKDYSFQMELASSIKHSDAGSTSLGLDMQTVGKDMAYTLRGETRVTNFRRNNTAAGGSVTILGDTVSVGVKIEDKLVVNKMIRLLMSGGAMLGRSDVAYGGRLEATLRDRYYPIGHSLSTVALSVVDWHGELAIGCNLQSQFPLGRGTNLVGHLNLNNKGTGQVGIRLNSSDQLQIALIALVPIFKHVNRLLFGSPQFFD